MKIQKNVSASASRGRDGFTLIELLVVMGVIAIIATIVLVAINPARQFAQSRNTQRVSNVNALLNAVSQRMADNRGIFETGCAAGPISSTTTKTMASADYDILPCISPTYVSAIPFDPKDGFYNTDSDYSTGYTIVASTTGRITVSAPSAELDESISVTR